MRRLVEIAVPLPLQDSWTYAVPEDLVDRAEVGARVKVPFGRRKLVGYILGLPEKTSLDKLRDVEDVLDTPPLLTPALLELGRWIATYYACSLGEALRAVLPTGAHRKRGRRRGRQVETSGSAALLEQAPPETLNHWQEDIRRRVRARLDEGGYEAFLLYGVTGSGKTEVYLRLIRACMELRRSSILLIPEIALTPQTADRFRARLGTEVGILHSGMTLAERHDVLTAAAQGEIQVVLGARSAVFAPFRNLGLIIVDEEHESSYKQGEKPRYHARSVALMRGRLEGAAVLLGSATPSLESYQNTRTAKHELLTIPERVDGRPMARVHVIDMRTEENHNVIFSQPLLDALETRLERQEQSIILLNRRGHSNYLQCFACGEIVRCPHCDISLTFHAVGNQLRCHYCDYRCAVPRNCPQCQNPCQILRGHGTQRLEQELSGLFPEVRLLRMDFDTTSRRGMHREILEEFASGEVDILLGTQMVAKGHDFPGVTLVGVVQADAGLSLPDFRAAERTFHLLAQVAGRAGRGSRPGDVFIQTLCPDHYTIQQAARQDYEAFFEHESELRRSLRYPPHARLVAITGLGSNAESLGRSMRRVAERLRRPAARVAGGTQASPGIQVLGPAPSAIPRLRGRYREQILIKGGLGAASKEGLRELLEAVSRQAPGVEFQVDVDPVNLL
jgi:primosomal protein N' (replication factor Y)